MGQESPKELVKTHENVELEKRLRIPKESKWAKDAREENKWDTRARKQFNKKPNDYIESLREE